MRPDPNARDQGVYIGRELLQGMQGGDKKYYNGRLHQVLLGTTGVGKGMRLLAPNLLHMTGRSIVVIDPKGQLTAMTALHRHRMGNIVKIVDPFGLMGQLVKERADEFGDLERAGLSESAGFNPLAALDPKGPTFYDDAAIIAEALVKVEGSEEPHWPESARGLVTGLVMWERLVFGIEGTLQHVRQMLTEADGESKGLHYHAEMMVLHGGFEIESLAGRFATKKDWSDELDSIRSFADTQTRWILSRVMRDDISKSGVDFSSLKRADRPTTIYVILPSIYLETHSVWLRLIVSEALRSSMVMGGRDVMLMMDEFAALDHLPIVQRMWGVARDYGVIMWAILQDLDQLMKRYQTGWNTMISSTGIVQSFRTGDPETADWLSKRSPPITKVMRGYNSNTGPDGKPTNGMSYSQIEKRQIELHHLYGLPSEISISYINGEALPARLYMPHIKDMLRTYALALPNPYYAGWKFKPPLVPNVPLRLGRA